jgi:vacuolar-type H+-ATPase subunit E/Vma4
MSLEKIIERIISDAEEEAGRIVLASRRKAEGIIREAEKEAAERSAAFLREAERESSFLANQVMAQARLEKKIAVLRERRKLLDLVLEKAFRQAAPEKIRLKRQVVVRDGITEEDLDRKKLLEEMRPLLEKDIVEALGI